MERQPEQPVINFWLYEQFFFGEGSQNRTLEIE